jgi:hypothetical protein
MRGAPFTFGLTSQGKYYRIRALNAMGSAIRDPIFLTYYSPFCAFNISQSKFLKTFLKEVYNEFDEQVEILRIG